MAIFEFKLPDLGEGVVEGEIVKWLVKEGDVIAEDARLVEVMTDKATVEVPSPKAGKVVKLHGKEGDVARVHHPLVSIEVEGAAATSPTHAPQLTTHNAAESAAVVTAPVHATPAKPAVSAEKVLATPVTRRMAREHGLDLTEISGSGPQGRVTKADVVAALEGGAAGGAAANVTANRAKTPAPAPLAHTAEDVRIPIRGLRKKIAEKMIRSKHSAAHFTFVEEMDATELVALRKRLNEQLAAAGDKTRLTFLPFICKAVVAGLKKFPELNSNFDEANQELIQRGQYNLGIAASTEEGLTVPVVKNADRLSLRALASEIGRLGNAAREKKLKMDELTGGTFTITSLGQLGGLFATPIINHPEVGILGVHKMRKRPVVVDDQVVVREMMYLSLSFDHRVIDGSVGAEFTYEVIRYLEHPELLMLEMA